MSRPALTHPIVVRLKSVADEKLLTQREIAEQLGVSERTVSYWFTTDTTPQKRYLRVVLDWLDQQEDAA